ncbi:hypothetical protein LUZ60_005369 [Juncus effusus]|nr:hypothetical protein LUZ60_005369 [Juncus effusus]
MMRNRSRAVGTKQSLMSDPPSLPSLNKTKLYSLSPSPRSLMAFSPKKFSESDSIMSPTSILDSKSLHSVSSDPFLPSLNQKKEKPVCLGLVEALDDSEQNHKFSPKFRIQIPSFETNFPIEFGVRNKETKLALLSPGGRYKLKQNVDIYENDRSEEYTCVISHGPNRKTTHIFEDRVINGDLCNFELNKILSSCHACEKKKEASMDSRNENESCECDNQEVILDGGMEKTGDL